MRRIALACLATLAALAHGPAATADAGKGTVGLRYPSLTPDGRQVLFDYRGDIWRAPVDGKGHAVRLTFHEAQDTLPRVSPDGTQVAFASRRNGGYDLFVMPVDGGAPSQVTFHSGVELLCDWSPDGKSLLFLSNREPSLWQMDLYEVAVAGGTPQRLTRDGGREGCWSLDGKRLLYVRGFNTIYQDDYTGSANYDIHMLDGRGTTPKRLFETPGNERWPFLSADGEAVYFVAEEQGVANLYRAPLAGGPRTQVTKGAGLDVHRLSPSADRKKVVLERGGKLAWVDLEEPGTPFHDMPIVVQADERSSGLDVRTITEGGEQVDVARDGSRVVFVLHGDIWSMPGGGGAAQRLTQTPEDEQWPRLSPDGRRLAFASEASGNSDIYLMDLGTKAVTPVTRHKADDFFHTWSPDGTRLAFASERSGNRDIWTIELAGGKETQLTTHAAADDDPAWSPDGRNIAFDSARDGNGAIFVMPAEGGNARRVSTGSGFFQVPSWSPDGAWLVFESFQPDSGQSGGLFVVGSGGGAQMQISRDGQAACWARTGDWIYFHATRDEEEGIWRLPAPRGVSVGERVPFLGRIEVDRRRELADLFDEAWKRLKDGFYDPKMHAVDWNAMKAKYRDMAADAENKETFYNIVNQMLAELGASHLGISPGGADEEEPRSARGASTGTLGMELEPIDGATERKVIALAPGGPAEKIGIKVGDIVRSVQGQPLAPGLDLDRVLTGLAGKDVKLVLGPLEGATDARDVTVKAVGLGALGNAYVERWRARTEARVKELGKGKVGYVHLDQMNPENLSRFQSHVTRFLGNKSIQGMVLDVRENGGGNIHVQLMAILQARPYVRMQPRGLPRISQPQHYWDKPVVVLVNERSFSDAEVFPWSFKAAGLGTTVGMPTPGGVIGTQDVTLSDGSRFRVPRVGWYSLDGQNLERNGFVPDVLVPETTEDRLQGRDPQLDKAMEIVLGQIAARGGPAPAPTEPTSTEPTSAEPGEQPQDPVALATDTLSDAKVGEWVRYRVTRAGADAGQVRLEVIAATDGSVKLAREGAFDAPGLPPLPEALAQGPLGTLLSTLGTVKGSRAVTTQVGSASAPGVRVVLEVQGHTHELVFTNAVPALGLLRAEGEGGVVLQATEWGAAPAPKPAPAPAPGTPGPGDVPSPAPTPPQPPAVPPEPAPKPESAPAPKEGAVADEGGEGAADADGGIEIDNPLADAKVGEWVRLRQTIRGATSVVRLEVVEVGDAEVVLRSVTEADGATVEGAPLKRARSPRLAVGRGRPSDQIASREETLTVSGQALACTAVTVPSRRGGAGVTTWYSRAVPVTGVVRRTRGDEVLIELLAWGTP